jgi:zinc-ribbon domain
VFCDQCGREVASDARFCSSCGRAISSIGPAAPPSLSAPQYVQPVPANRVNAHIRTLGILWLICGVLRVFSVGSLWFVGRAILPSVLSYVPGIAASTSIGRLIEGGMVFASGILAMQAVLAFIAAWGLLERQSWGRMLAIIVGILALFRIPLGTALGIYTLWVLLPASSEAEYRNFARV